MPDVLIDTSIAIDFLHGNSLAEEFLRSMPSSRLRTHTVVVGELIEGALDASDLRSISHITSRFRVIHPTESDCVNSLALLRHGVLRHGIGWADAMIAATAMRLHAAVATTNDKHFRVFHGLEVVRPY